MLYSLWRIGPTLPQALHKDFMRATNALFAPRRCRGLGKRQ